MDTEKKRSSNFPFIIGSISLKDWVTNKFMYEALG